MNVRRAWGWGWRVAAAFNMWAQGPARRTVTALQTPATRTDSCRTGLQPFFYALGGRMGPSGARVHASSKTRHGRAGPATLGCPSLFPVCTQSQRHRMTQGPHLNPCDVVERLGMPPAGRPAGRAGKTSFEMGLASPAPRFSFFYGPPTPDLPPTRLARHFGAIGGWDGRVPGWRRLSANPSLTRQAAHADKSARPGWVHTHFQRAPCPPPPALPAPPDQPLTMSRTATFVLAAMLLAVPALAADRKLAQAAAGGSSGGGSSSTTAAVNGNNGGGLGFCFPLGPQPFAPIICPGSGLGGGNNGGAPPGAAASRGSTSTPAAVGR